MPSSARTAAIAMLLAGCSRPAPTRSDDNAWRADLHVLVTELPRRDAAFAQVSAPAWRAQGEALDDALDRLDEPHVVAGFARLVAAIGDGHTMIGALGRHGVYPLALMWFDDGIFVAGADEPWAIGKKLVAIGPHGIDDAVARLTPLVAHDNVAGLHGQLPGVLVDPEMLAGADLAALDRATFELAGPDGSIRALTLAPAAHAVAIAPPAHLPLAMHGPSTLYWNTYDADHQLVYLQYNACANDPHVGPFARFAAETLAFIDQHPVARVVIDLRRNEGGDSQILEPLIAGLAARPALAGRVFVIIGMHTFSSAVLDAMQLVRRAHARLVGGPSAGAPSGYGEIGTLVLPHSHIAVQYSTKRFSNPDFAGDALRPDLPVTSRSADWFAGTDPALDAILAAPVPAAPGPKPAPAPSRP